LTNATLDNKSLKSASQGTSPAYESRRLINLIWSYTCLSVPAWLTFILSSK